MRIGPAPAKRRDGAISPSGGRSAAQPGDEPRVVSATPSSEPARLTAIQETGPPCGVGGVCRFPDTARCGGFIHTGRATSRITCVDLPARSLLCLSARGADQIVAEPDHRLLHGAEIVAEAGGGEQRGGAGVPVDQRAAGGGEAEPDLTFVL